MKLDSEDLRLSKQIRRAHVKRTERLVLHRRSFKIARVWMPVNMIFVGMIWTSFFALKNLGVPMATVLKNLTNLFAIVGDYLLYGKVCSRAHTANEHAEECVMHTVRKCSNADYKLLGGSSMLLFRHCAHGQSSLSASWHVTLLHILQVYGPGVWASLALMCASALCGSVTDLAFDLEGYLWQLINCLFTASYSLYLRGVMDRVVGLTVNKTRLDEFSMVRLLSPQKSPALAS